MENLEINVEKEVKLKSPILIEGLPGLGLVGKIATEHLIDELKAEKLATLRSTYFPPQVIIQKDGTIKMMQDEFYYWKAKEKNQKDLLFIIGDHQGTTPEAHYHISSKVLDFAEMYKTKEISTLGGYGVGHLSKKPKVFGAITHQKLKKPLKDIGVSFEKTGGGIVGAAGLLIGLGKERGMEGYCLMGETHGQIIDARSAKSVLGVLSKRLNIEINTKKLDKKAKETEKAIKRAQKLEKQKQAMNYPPEPEGQAYFR